MNILKHRKNNFEMYYLCQILRSVECAKVDLRWCGYLTLSYIDESGNNCSCWLGQFDKKGFDGLYYHYHGNCQ